MEVKISKGRGRTKTEFFDHAIIRVGSAESNHIRVDSKQALPFHLQILNNTNTNQKNYLVNLTDLPLAVTLSQEAFWLSPYATAELNNGDSVEVGDVQLVVNLPIKDNIVMASRFFEAELALPTPFLLPDTILEGMLSLKNIGEQRGCKFKVDVDGLPEDCLDIDPVPLLYPGALEKIPFRILHKSTAPEPGYTNFQLVITSPESYPDQKVILQYKVYVAPSFKQQIRISEVVGDVAEVMPIESTVKRTWKTVTFESVSAEQREKTVEKIKEEVIQEVAAEQIAEDMVSQEESPPLPEETPQDQLAGESGDARPETGEQDEEPLAESPIEEPPLAEDSGKPSVKVIGNKFKNFWEDDE